MLTPGANFAEAVCVRLNLPTQGVRSVSIPGALIVLASAHVASENASCANCDAIAPTPAGVTLSVTLFAAEKRRHVSTRLARGAHNARNWSPCSARSQGRRLATELGLAGRAVVMSHPALLLTT
jgi:hypothetical protein